MAPRAPCPVCGRHYRGNLIDHLDKAVRGSNGLSRCCWNLTMDRLDLTVARIKASGWVAAGSTAARVLQMVNGTHPHLAWHACSGGYPARPHVSVLNPENDPKIWWTRPWCRAVGSCRSYPLIARAQYLREIDLLPEFQMVVDATARVADETAVTELLGTLPRCSAECTVKLQHADRFGKNFHTDWCVLPKNHSELHQSGRYGQRW